MAKKKIRDLLKRPDQFVQFFGEVLRDITQNWKMTVMTAIGILLVLGGIIGWQHWSKSQDLAAANAFWLLEKEMPDMALMEEEDGLGANWRDWSEKLEAFLSEHQGASMAPMARLYLGKAYFHQGKYEEALKVYGQARRGLKKPFRYLAEEGEANAHIGMKDWNDAERIWQTLVQAKDNPLRDIHMWRLGMTQEWAQRKEEALNTYASFEKEFAESHMLEKVKERIFAIQSEVSL